MPWGPWDRGPGMLSWNPGRGREAGKVARVGTDQRRGLGPHATLWALAVLLLILAGCASEALTAEQRERLELFDACWDTLSEDYPYFDRLGLSADELRQQYRNASVYVEQPHEFYHLLAGMLSELNDPHVSLSVPLQHMQGHGLRPTNALATPGLELAWGPPGGSVELVLRWPDGQLSRELLMRPVESMSPFAEVEAVNRQLALTRPSSFIMSVLAEGRWNRLRITALNKALMTVTGEVEGEFMDQMISRAAEADGIVLDLRTNAGGDADVMATVAGRFLPHPVTYAASKPNSA